MAACIACVHDTGNFKNHLMIHRLVSNLRVFLCVIAMTSKSEVEKSDCDSC